MAYLLQGLLSWLHTTATSYDCESIEPRIIDHFSLSRAERSSTRHLNRLPCLPWTTPSRSLPNKQQSSWNSQKFKAQFSPVLRSIKMHPSWKEFTRRPSSKVCHTKQSSGIAALPSDLKRHIMQRLPTVQALLDFTLTSKLFYEFKVEHDHVIMPFVLRNELGQAVFEEAYFVAKATRTDLLHADYAEQLSKFLLEMVDCKTCSLQPKSVSLQDAIAMYKFHQKVTYLVMDFCTWALENSADLRDSCGIKLRLSPSEKIRITRAFYRLELICTLFRDRFILGDGDEDVQVKRKTSGPQASQFFEIWPAWENEEIACIRDYVYDRLPNVFSNIEEAASTKPFEVIVGYPWEPEPEDLPPNAVYICDSLEPRWYDENLACRVKFANPVYSDELSEMILRQGLGYISQLLSAKSPEEQVVLFQSKWTEFGCNVNGLALVSSELSSQPIDVLKKGEMNEAFFHGDEESFQSDEEAAAANSAWVWAGGQKIQPHHALTARQGLRRWGYVMWDFERLKNASLCQSTRELSDNFSWCPKSYFQLENKMCMRKASEQAGTTDTTDTTITAATTDMPDRFDADDADEAAEFVEVFRAVDTHDTAKISKTADADDATDPEEGTEAIDGGGSESDSSNSDPNMVFSEKESDDDSCSNKSMEHKEKNEHEPMSPHQAHDEVARLREPETNLSPLSSTSFPAQPGAPHWPDGSVEDVQGDENVLPGAASAASTSQTELEEEGLDDQVLYERTTRTTEEFQNDASYVEAAVFDDSAVAAPQAAEVELRKPNLHNFEFDLLPGDHPLALNNILGQLTSSTTLPETRLDELLPDSEGFQLDPQLEIEGAHQDTNTVRDDDSKCVHLESSLQYTVPMTLFSTRDKVVSTDAEGNEDDSDDEVNFITESSCPPEVFMFKAGIGDKGSGTEQDGSKDGKASQAFGDSSALADNLPICPVPDEEDVPEVPRPRKIAQAISPKTRILKRQQTAVQKPEQQVLDAKGPHLRNTSPGRTIAHAISPKDEKSEQPAPGLMVAETPGPVLYANQNCTVAVACVPFTGIPNCNKSSSEPTFYNRPEIPYLPQSNEPCMPLFRTSKAFPGPPRGPIKSCSELQHPTGMSSTTPETPNHKDCHDVTSHTEISGEGVRQELSTRSPNDLAAWIEGAPLPQLPILPRTLSSEPVNSKEHSDDSNASKPQRKKAIPKSRRAALGSAVKQGQAIQAEGATEDAEPLSQLPNPPQTTCSQSTIFRDPNNHNGASIIQRKKVTPQSRKVVVEPAMKQEQVMQAKAENEEAAEKFVKIFEAKKDPMKEVTGPDGKDKKKPQKGGRGKSKAKGGKEKMVGYLFG